MALTSDERFRRVHNWAKDVGFLGGFPNFQEADYGLGRVGGVHLLRDTVAEWRDVSIATYNGATIDDVPALFRGAATYAVANGYSGAFPTCHQGNDGQGVVYGTILIKPNVATWRDVPRSELENATVDDVPAMMRATSVYAANQGFAAAFPTFHQSAVNGHTVYGVILFPEFTAHWRDVYFDDLQPRQERTCVILCRFRDDNGVLLPEAAPPTFYHRYFFELGNGGLGDYFRRISHWQLELAGGVFGWFDIGHTLAEHAGKVHQEQRRQAYAWGITAAQAGGVRPSDYSRRVVIINASSDVGGTGLGTSMLMAHGAGLPLNHSAMQHEFGHVLGLQDSWWTPPDTKYGDDYCVMSFATVGLRFQDTVEGVTAESGPGINAVYVDQLGGLPPRRVISVGHITAPVDLELLALGNPERDGIMVARIGPDGPRVNTYWLEYRHPSRWDRSFETPIIAVHETRPNNPRSYLLTGLTGVELQVGGDFAIANGALVVRSNAVSADGFVASVRVWRLGLEGRRRVLIREVVSEGPGDDLTYEKVVIQNDDSTPQNLQGWQLRDSANHPETAAFTYTFPSHLLNPGDSVAVWTREGDDDAANLYWGRKAPVWNNRGDRAVIADPNGVEISVFQYSR